MAWQACVPPTLRKITADLCDRAQATTAAPMYGLPQIGPSDANNSHVGSSALPRSHRTVASRTELSMTTIPSIPPCPSAVVFGRPTAVTILFSHWVRELPRARHRTRPCSEMFSPMVLFLASADTSKNPSMARNHGIRCMIDWRTCPDDITIASTPSLTVSPISMIPSPCHT